MSRKLYWRPGSVHPENELPDALKRELAPPYWGHDGAARDSAPHQLTEEHIPQLQALADRGIDGADALITAIREHDNRIVVWISGPLTRPLKGR
ncbi:hypothetical protein [Streptomyces sp. NPDC020917]|uniref:hypothetical protein n=1 Tax=Streptomyces sp. NPDC020917 TaxID=3365102 RepID=UPI0037B11257